MTTANTGEWSELYALLKLLNDGVLKQGNPDLSISSRAPYEIVKIIRLDKTAPETIERCTYTLSADSIKIAKGNKLTSASRDELQKMGSIILKQMQAHSKGKGAYEILGSSEILKSLSLKSVANKISKEADLLIELIDHRNLQTHERGFSIKSVMGGDPHYLNATKGTRFQTKIMGLGSADIDTIKKFDKEHKKGWVMDTVSYIDKLAKSGRIQLTHCGPLSNTLRNNLLLIDDGMNNIISNLLWNAYSNRSLRIKDAIKTVIARNPRNYGSDCNLELFYKQKVIRLMVAASMGLTGSKEWTENYESDGGFIVVLKSGDVISFHFYDRKDFEEYLFNYSRIETGSTSRHDFGTLYECELGHALNLCMTLRFDF